jgi:hypothetical protein
MLAEEVFKPLAFGLGPPRLGLVGWHGHRAVFAAVPVLSFHHGRPLDPLGRSRPFLD